MPSWWGKSSSKDVKKKTTKENFIDTIQKLISPTEQKNGVKARGGRKRNNDAASEIWSRSRAESRSTSPSTQVSRCQSFADRPLSQPLPRPTLHSGITRTASEVSTSKAILEKRGKPQLVLPLPKPSHPVKGLDTPDIDGDLAIASVSSTCSIDSDDPADSQLHSPMGNEFYSRNRSAANNHLSGLHKDCSPITQKNPTEMTKPKNKVLRNQSPKHAVRSSYQSSTQIHRHGALGSAPDSSMSSPSRTPITVVCPELIPTAAFYAAKPYPDVTFLGSGQCSSPGSGQTSGHNSLGGDMLGQLWQHSRGSPECSPIPSPRMTSPGPNSRIHSGAVSPLHPRAGGTAPESPASRHNDGKKQSHILPLPPINISSSSPFGPNSSTANNSPSIPRSPGRTDNTSYPTSPGSRWKKGKMIGRGTFGHVYVGFNSESGEMCAMKEVTLFMDDNKSKESAKHLGQEISLLSRLHHPNIVQYYGCEMIDDKLYIYLEYVSGGSIHKLLQEYGKFGEPATRSYTKQILSGLAYLHAKNTVHRDIKGANILVDPNGRVKLADFGMAKHITGQSCPLSFKGSPYWMAPEVIKNSNGCNLAVDVWSLGCTVLEMATSKPPWSQYEGIAAMFKIGNSKELPAIPEHLSDEGKDFIRRCLQREPSNRPTAAELLQHPFVKDAAPLDKPILGSQPLEVPMGISSILNTKNSGHARNLSSLDMEGLTTYHVRGGKSATLASDVHTRYISCPVSPIGSPIFNSRSPRYVNGRMSPSPISSPRATSGASTPLSGGSGAIPFSQPKQASYLHDVFTSSSRTMNDLCGAIHHEPKLDLFTGVQQSSPNLPERITTDILSPQIVTVGHGHLWDRQPMLADQMSHQILRNQLKSNPSLDLTYGSSVFGRTNGI